MILQSLSAKAVIITLSVDYIYIYIWIWIWTDNQQNLLMIHRISLEYDVDINTICITDSKGLQVYWRQGIFYLPIGCTDASDLIYIFYYLLPLNIIWKMHRK